MDLKTFYHALATSFLSYRPHFRHPRGRPLPPQARDKFINIQHCYWIGSWTELLHGRERISNFTKLKDTVRLRPPPKKITETRVMASNAIRCIHTHTLHTHTIPKNHPDLEFCRDMLGQDAGRFKFLSCGNHTEKSHDLNHQI